jgi:hypothetical protein
VIAEGHASKLSAAPQKGHMQKGFLLKLIPGLGSISKTEDLAKSLSDD